MKKILFFALLLALGCQSPRSEPEAEAETQPAPQGLPVLVIAADGLDPVLVRELDLPHLSALMQRGASGIVYSEREIRSPPLWTTVATGRPRHVHGIWDFVTGSRYWPEDERSDERRLVTGDARRVPAVWNLASAAQREVAVVGWLNTWPAETVNGTFVAPYVAIGNAKQFTIKGAVYEDESGQVFPADAWPQVSRRIVAPKDVPADLVKRFIKPGHDQLAQDFSHLRTYDDALRWSLAHTLTMSGIAEHLLRTETPDLTMVYFEAADSLSHRFWLFREPTSVVAARLRAYGWSPDHAEPLKATYGDVIHEYYRLLDEHIGRLVAAAPKNARIIVVSDHGFGSWRFPTAPSTQVPFTGEHRLEGFVAIAGPGIPAGSSLHGATLYDIAPTVLDALDLPMPTLEGRVLQPTVASAADRNGSDDRGVADRVESVEIERLESLGYLE